MNKYCGNCGHPLSDGAKFCVNCGQPLNARNEKQNIATESKKEPAKENVVQSSQKEPAKENAKQSSQKEPAKENANATTPKGNVKQKESEIATTPKGNAKHKKGGFFTKLIEEVKDLIRHPKKLLPTIVLSVFWMVFPMLSAFGANIPILRFLYTLTYANGGMFGGFFGAVGGIFGKAVFATVVNTIILALVAKKNPFANATKSLKGIFGKAAFSGLSAISPFLVGAGVGLVLYWFFNITSSPVNCGVAVVGAVGAFSAIGKKNGIITSLVYTVAGKLTKGKFPSQVIVNRTITGFSAGFALGLPLTFVRFGWLLFLVGAIILAAGIVFAVVGKKGARKAVATAAIFILTSAMMLPVFFTNVLAADTSLPKGYVPMDQVFRLEDGDGSQPVHYSKVDGFYLVLTHIESRSFHIGGNAVYGVDPVLNSEDLSANQTISDKPSFTVTRTKDADGFTVSGKYDWKHTYTGEPGSPYKAGDNVIYRSDITLTASNITFEDYKVYADINGRLNADSGYNDVFSKPETYDLVGTHVEGKYHFDAENDIVHISFYVNSPSSPRTGASLYFRIDGVLPKNKTTSGGSSTAITQDDPEYKPYRGYLTYTNGEKNKNGQPFPDLMDFNDDGEINWLDVAIQKELSHNPDWLDLPASKGAAAALAIITALLGGAGGAVGGALGGPLGSLLGSAAQAASSAAEGAFSGIADGMNVPEQQEEPSQKEDLGRYIRRDPDGDLYVKDPVTGKETLYIKQEDGSYRNTVSDQNYTVGEIKNMVSHVEENSGYYSDISKKQQEAVAYQHEHASDFSETSVKLAEQIRQQKEQDAKEDAINKIGYEHGVYNGDEDAIRERLKQKQAVEESINDDYHRVAANIDTAVKVAEGTKKVADVAADVVGTVDKTGIFKDVYSATTAAAGNAGEVMAGNMTAAEAVAKTAVDASTEIIKNRASSTGAKFAANILGDSAQDATSAMLEGKDLGEVTNAAIAGAGRGLLDSTVDYAISTGNKAVASSGRQSLTDAGEALASDLAKSALPKVEVPKKKEE